MDLHQTRNRPRRAPRSALHRYGVNSARLFVGYEGEPPSSLDGMVANHAHLSLVRRYAYEQETFHETVLALTFQRHRLDRGPRHLAADYLRPSPRFDYTHVPWSAFYGPTVEMRFRGGEHRKMTVAARLLAFLYRQPVSDPPTCELERYLMVLERLRVPLELKHVLAPGAVLTADELAASDVPRGLGAAYLGVSTAHYG